MTEEFVIFDKYITILPSFPGHTLVEFFYIWTKQKSKNSDSELR